jgi:hypothetical protein
MECPKCGYVLSPFDIECPRCKKYPDAPKLAPPTAPKDNAPVVLEPAQWPPPLGPTATLPFSNDSGTGTSAVCPDELRDWNWGAFLCGFLWSICHNVRQGILYGLIALIPCVGLIPMCLLGAKGNEWAWQNRRWNSIEQFKKVQSGWVIGGIILNIIFIPFILDYRLIAAIAEHCLASK